MKVWIAWCANGCPPFAFSTKEKAEAFVTSDENKCFNVTELPIDAPEAR